MKKLLCIFSTIVLVISCQKEDKDLEGHWTSMRIETSTNGIKSNGFLGGTIIFRNDSIFAFNSHDFLKIRASYAIKNDSLLIESDPRLSYGIVLNENELILTGYNKAFNKRVEETYVLIKLDFIIPNEKELLRDTINYSTLKNSEWLQIDTTEANFYYNVNSKYQRVRSEDSSQLKELPVKINFNDPEVSFKTALTFYFNNETFHIEELKSNTLSIQKVRNDTTWYAKYTGKKITN